MLRGGFLCMRVFTLNIIKSYNTAKANAMTSKIRHYAIAIPMQILRSGIEEKAKAERRMNEQRSKDDRRMNEG